jgi:GNAT superfamily N-acetyltransferase
MMRPILPSDTPGLVSVCEQAGVFSMDEMPELQMLFDDYHEKNVHAGHLAFAEEEGGLLVGVVYLAPKQFTDRTWEMLMIMIVGSRQGQGLGTRMLLEVEEQLRKVNARLLLIETISIPELEQTRQFYRKNGYSEVALVPDYYANGQGRVSFVKHL